jgi:hypothetical protein
MSSTNSFQERVYWVKTPDGILGGPSTGTFEFHTEANARKHIKEQKIKKAKVILVYRNITESITEL